MERGMGFPPLIHLITIEFQVYLIYNFGYIIYEICRGLGVLLGWYRFSFQGHGPTACHLNLVTGFKSFFRGELTPKVTVMGKKSSK